MGRKNKKKAFREAEAPSSNTTSFNEFNSERSESYSKEYKSKKSWKSFLKFGMNIPIDIMEKLGDAMPALKPIFQGVSGILNGVLPGGTSHRYQDINNKYRYKDIDNKDSSKEQKNASNTVVNLSKAGSIDLLEIKKVIWGFTTRDGLNNVSRASYEKTVQKLKNAAVDTAKAKTLPDLTAIVHSLDSKILTTAYIKKIKNVSHQEAVNSADLYIADHPEEALDVIKLLGA